MDWWDDARRIFIIFGGIDNQSKDLNDTWFFNRDTLKWTRIVYVEGCAVPQPRSSHSGVVCEEALYIFGGACDDTIYNDLWRLSVKDGRWDKIELFENSIFRPLYAHVGGAFLHENQFRYFIFGGLTNVGTNQMRNVRSSDLCYEFVLCEDYEQTRSFHLNDFELQDEKLDLFEELDLL